MVNRLNRIKKIDTSNVAFPVEKPEPLSFAKVVTRIADGLEVGLESLNKGLESLNRGAKSFRKAAEDWEKKAIRDREIWESKAPEREAAHRAKVAALKAEIARIERDTAELKRKREKQP